MNYKKLFLLMLCLVVFITSVAAVKEYRRITNLRVKGWLFADTSWAGKEQWSYTAAVDTLAISGISATTHYAFVTMLNNVGAHSVSASIGANDDTLFVTCDTNLSSSYYYYWMILAK